VGQPLAERSQHRALLNRRAHEVMTRRPVTVFCLSRNWNLPSRGLAAILSRRITHASSAPALYP
jgi:hypothetical protein